MPRRGVVSRGVVCKAGVVILAGSHFRGDKRRTVHDLQARSWEEDLALLGAIYACSRAVAFNHCIVTHSRGKNVSQLEGVFV
jgi:hypothetical protein